jgi:DhnA family fructose-bisphosphate aldolase class Ia
MTGKKIRLGRIFRLDRRSVILPMDDAMISGPTGQLAQPDNLIRLADEAEVDAILAHPGTLSRIPPRSRLGRIQNLSASTVRSQHSRKYMIGSVEQAIASGADAVAVHVNISSAFEREMLGDLSRAIIESQQYGFPVLAIAYPRRENLDGSDDNYESMRRDDPDGYQRLVAHCVRIAVEIGADIVKTQYTGSPESFSTIIEAACSVPVVVAGGPVLQWSELRSMVVGALQGGAAGVSIGRNVHQSSTDVGAVLRNLVELTHN